MDGLRAYALPVADLRGAIGVTGPRRERLRELVETALAPPPTPVRDRLGPIHRRVPGAPVLAADDPTPADLGRLLDGGPVAPDRAAATWRLVEALAGVLAASTTTVPGALPDGLLAPLDLPVPPVDDVVAGWCTCAAADAVDGLRGWAAALPPAVDVVVLGRPGA